LNHQLKRRQKDNKYFFGEKFFEKNKSLIFSAHLQVFENFDAEIFLLLDLEHPQNNKNNLWAKFFFEKKFSPFPRNLDDVGLIFFLLSFNLHDLKMFDARNFLIGRLRDGENNVQEIQKK